ncbi:MAG TPA: hypothetical protein VHC43_05895 [Mycobacteriales bacterium]|nr:hypothetical protein [Mycobacteriales bacterium]
MTISETARREMHTRLVEILGTEVADTLMEHLPPVGWGDVATKRDIDAHHAMTKRDLDTHRAMTKRDLDTHHAMTKRELDDHRAMTQRDLDTHHAMTKRDLDTLAVDLRGEFHSRCDRLELAVTDRLNQQTRTLLLGVAAMMAATVSAVSALVSVAH